MEPMMILGKPVTYERYKSKLRMMCYQLKWLKKHKTDGTWHGPKETLDGQITMLEFCIEVMREFKDELVGRRKRSEPIDYSGLNVQLRQDERNDGEELQLLPGHQNGEKLQEG